MSKRRTNARRVRLLQRPRSPDPVLTKDELDWLADVARDRVSAHSRIMARQKVSESVIRSRMTGEDVLAKLYAAGAWRPSESPVAADGEEQAG
jgi:hypothetical protein